jgi:hypothetical protein
MKTLKQFAFFSILFVTFQVNAQVVSNLKPSVDGKINEFSEWKSFNDGSSISFDYRIALVSRKGIACHYDVEVKNTSSSKLEFKLKSSYYDKFVKGNYGDEIKETLKPDKSVSARFIAQGCKKEKGVEKDDFGHCMACDFGVNIFVEK